MSISAAPPSHDAVKADAGARWGLTAAGFGALLNLYAPQAILPTLARVFDAQPVQVGLTITATTLAVALCGPFAGALADRMGRKRAIVASLLLLAVPTLLCAFARTLPQLIALRFMQGVFMPAIFAGALGYVAERWSRDQVGRAMSLYIASTVSGGFAGRFLGGAAASLTDWHWSFATLAGLDVAAAALVWWLLPETGTRGARLSPMQAARVIFAHLSDRQLLAAYAVGFNVLFGLVAMFTYVNFHLAAAPYALSPGSLGLVFCVYLVGIAVTPWAGHWIDRLGQRRMLLMATVVAAFGCALTLLPPLSTVIAGLAIFCSGAFVCQSSATSYVGMVAGANRSSAAGLYMTFYYAGGAAGAVLPGLAWSLGGWPACVGFAVVVQALVAALALRLQTGAAAPPCEPDPATVTGPRTS
jgi:predicted MFS family arabinose efflux permease